MAKGIRGVLISNIVALMDKHQLGFADIDRMHAAGRSKSGADTYDRLLTKSASPQLRKLRK